MGLFDKCDQLQVPQSVVPPVNAKPVVSAAKKPVAKPKSAPQAAPPVSTSAQIKTSSSLLQKTLRLKLDVPAAKPRQAPSVKEPEFVAPVIPVPGTITAPLVQPIRKQPFQPLGLRPPDSADSDLPEIDEPVLPQIPVSEPVYAKTEQSTPAPADTGEAPVPIDGGAHIEYLGDAERRNLGTNFSEYTDRRDRRKRETPPNVQDVDRRADEQDRRRSRRNVEGYNTLTAINLQKSFGRKQIVRGVGFSMKGGEVAGLLGPNGAGKTTIFYMIVGFYKPTAGDIKLNNESIVRGPMYRRARMGIAYLPQDASIFRKLTVEENIWAILESRKDLSKKQKKEKLDMLIEDFSIGRIRKQLGYTLSGGERRRTEIARALAIEPKFLLLDEPFAGIDPIAVFEIKQIIKRLAQENIGILITDHNVRDTLEITTDAFIINQGLIVARGNKDHILENQTVRDVYLGSEFRM